MCTHINTSTHYKVYLHVCFAVSRKLNSLKFVLCVAIFCERKDYVCVTKHFKESFFFTKKYKSLLTKNRIFWVILNGVKQTTAEHTKKSKRHFWTRKSQRKSFAKRQKRVLPCHNMQESSNRSIGITLIVKIDNICNIFSHLREIKRLFSSINTRFTYVTTKYSVIFIFYNWNL